MLQQILQDMYIHPDILAELDDEQKQLLFCKMREEQVRRWQEHEDKYQQPDASAIKCTGRRIEILLARDGEPWTWVMGDHPDDKSIEQLLEEEAQEKARVEAQTEAELMQRQAEEMAIKESMKIVKEAENNSQKLKDEQKKTELLRQKSIDESKRMLEKIRRSSQVHINEVKEQRENEIYSTMKLMRQKMSDMAERGHPLIEAAWKEQEMRAKKMENEKRTLARRAREEHRRSVSLSPDVDIQLGNPAATMCDRTNKPAIAKKPELTPQLKPRASRPSDTSAVISWFRSQEEPRGSGLDPLTGQVAPWFHGIISRQRAEQLLTDKPEGSFLVRVSEKVYGYAVSFKSATRCKHFLIDVTDDGYKLFGLNQLLHASLGNLISYHKTKTIGALEDERLCLPCGQDMDPPDTRHLFAESPSEVSHL